MEGDGNFFCSLFALCFCPYFGCSPIGTRAIACIDPLDCAIYSQWVWWIQMRRHWKKLKNPIISGRYIFFNSLSLSLSLFGLH